MKRSRLENDSNKVIIIEGLDDIELKNADETICIQTKLHVKGDANLTNSSVDFWKSIRVWSVLIKDGTINLEETLFSLITTQSVPQSSILHYFKEDMKEEDVEIVLQKMLNICHESTNASNKLAYDAFEELDIYQKKALIKQTKIIDNTFSVDEVDEEIKKELVFTTYPQHLDLFIEKLNGWWFKKAVSNLLGTIDNISSRELFINIMNISEEFKPNNLPNFFSEPLEISREELVEYQDKLFVKQLDIIEIKIHSRVAQNAISDFRRAFQQRSKWISEDLLNPEEDEAFEKKLIDYWRNLFGVLCDEAEKEEVEEVIKLGKAFYLENFVKKCPNIFIREKFREDYIVRGSYHILSDRKKLGWHPEYGKKL